MHRKNILYLSFSGYSEYSGISKKKLAQIKGLKECGCNVTNCYYTIDLNNGHRLWMVDDEILVELGGGIQAKIKKRIDYTPILTYIEKKQISFVYMRSEHNANPFLIHFVRKLRDSGVKIVMEIPTFPYDQEYLGLRRKLNLLIDRCFRRQLAKYLDAIVTFSDKDRIFGQRTIRISNGIDFDSIPLRSPVKITDSAIHLLGVAEIHYWHGFDRVIAGMVEYYKSNPSRKVYFHVVGALSGEREKMDILPLINENDLASYVLLYGPLWGEKLDEMFNKAHFGIGSLGRHRSGIDVIRTLKNREYAARGIAFGYSETDDDFDSKEYVMKFPANESPVDIEKIVKYCDNNTIAPSEIRESVKFLSWSHQMSIVINEIKFPSNDSHRNGNG